MAASPSIAPQRQTLYEVQQAFVPVGVGVRAKFHGPSRDSRQFFVPALRLFIVSPVSSRFAAIHATEVTFNLTEDRRGELAVADQDVDKPRMLYEMAHSTNGSQSGQARDPGLHVIDPLFVSVPFGPDRA
jgi:hypothetical protein